MNKKIWVITDGIQDNNDVLAVCSTAENAQIVSDFVDGHMVEIEIDEFVPRILAGEKCFTGYIYRDERYGVDMRVCTPSAGSHESEFEYPGRGQMFLVIWAKSVIEANKAAAAKRSAWLERLAALN